MGDQVKRDEISKLVIEVFNLVGFVQDMDKKIEAMNKTIQEMQEVVNNLVKKNR